MTKEYQLTCSICGRTFRDTRKQALRKFVNRHQGGHKRGVTIQEREAQHKIFVSSLQNQVSQLQHDLYFARGELKIAETEIERLKRVLEQIETVLVLHRLAAADAPPLLAAPAPAEKPEGPVQ